MLWALWKEGVLGDPPPLDGGHPKPLSCPDDGLIWPTGSSGPVPLKAFHTFRAEYLEGKRLRAALVTSDGIFCVVLKGHVIL